MSAVLPFSDEQLRALVNLRQRYEVWRDAERRQSSLPYDLRTKTVSGHRYLYEIFDRSGNGKSLGRLDETRQKQFDRFREEKQDLKGRIESAREALRESGLLARATRVPQLSSDAGRILREADRRGLLDGALLVVGTNCMIAYAQEAGGKIVEAADETQDFDLAWVAPDPADGTPVWDMLKSVDPTFTLNTEREFQARNRAAYEVELLVAPSREETLGRLDRPRAVPLREQEWLLLGSPVDQVVVCRDASAARIVAPDPRWFALHKLWLSAQPKRDPLKRDKDRNQGMALLDAVSEAMPQYPLDEAFAAGLPSDLSPHWDSWASGRAKKTR